MHLSGNEVPLRNLNLKRCCGAVILTGLLPLLACIATKSNGGSNPSVTVTISPTTATVAPNGQVSFTFALNPVPPQNTVNWYVNGVQGGDLQTTGIIDAMGNYTAPAHVPNPNPVTVTAEWTVNNTPSNNAEVTIQPLPVVTITPSPVIMPVGGTQTFTASVANVTNTAVNNWSVNGVAGGNSTVGTITSTGSNTATYTAPSVIPSTVTSGPFQATISATAEADNTTTGSAIANVHVMVVINGPPNNPTGAPPGAIGVGGNWLYTATVVGTSNQNVQWYPYTDGPGSCTPGAGSFPNSAGGGPYAGLYVAPGCVPPSPTITLTATSAFDPTQSATTAVTVQATDPLGAVSSSQQITCPSDIGGVAGATCYQLDVSCPGVDDFTTYLKVNSPNGTPLGTVILTTGSGGNNLYDVDPDFVESDGTNGGLVVVNGLLNASTANAGYTTVQVDFSTLDNPQAAPNGWLTGPGGVRRLACRYATVAEWVYANVHQSNTSAPFCATGNSGGAGAIGYALTEYGLDSIFTMVEPTSGPPMSHLDEGCVSSASTCQNTQQYDCNGNEMTISMCYSLSEAEIIDPAYSTGLCSAAVNGTAAPSGLFLSDSVMWAPANAFPSPSFTTNVNVVVGGSDTSSAVDQALTWQNDISSTASRVCVSDAQHAIPAVADGAQQIINDIQSMCKLTPGAKPQTARPGSR